MLPSSFLFSYIGFDADNLPIFDIQVDGTISRYPILGKSFSLTFDLSERDCTGWLDFENHKALPCPDQATVEKKYDQCIACRNKTGFNPAFYNASSVSEQQQAINRNPHFLYLAYFAPGLIKVGISQEARGIRRLLEQGARIAIKVETFPTAEIARQYEAKISALDGVVEHVVSRKKLDLLKTLFDETKAIDELKNVLDFASKSLNIAFNKYEIVRTTSCFNCQDVELSSAVIMKDQPNLIGNVRAIVGHTAILERDDRLLAYDLKRFVGYRANVCDENVEIELPSEQLALF